MSGQKNVRYVSTEYFDIIFCEESEKSAQKLFFNADSICKEICSGLGIDLPSYRMPVVITAVTDEFNAYFTNYNYNHIVLFDAHPSADINVFSDSILGTFRHELTHALTINMRNSFWQGVDSVMGDLINWGDYISMPPLIKEGASLVTESLGEEGRLNSGFYLHTIRQSKLDDRFLSYTDVLGARDIYPMFNLSYAYGGPFTQWLQETYGMERYALFWYNAVNVKGFTYAGAFRKAYEKSIGEAWNEFYESIWIPSIPSEPLENSFVEEFAAQKKYDGSVYGSLSSCDRGIAYADFADSSVWFAERNGDGSLLSAKKLLVKSGLRSLSLSADGQFVCLVYAKQKLSGTGLFCSLYRMSDGRIFDCPFSGVSEATLVSYGKELFLVCITKNGGVLCSVSQKNASLKIEQVCGFAEGSLLFSPCMAGEGRVAFFCRRNNSFSLARLSLSDMSLKEFPIPLDKISVRSLSFAGEDLDGALLSFSYSKKDTFPRLATVYLSESFADFEFMEEDVSGGVYSAVPLEKKENDFVYASDFVTEERLYVLDYDGVRKTKARSYGKNFYDGEAFLLNEEFSLAQKKWKHPYYKKGSLIPFTNIAIHSSTGGVSSRILFPGLSWLTNTPWDSDSMVISVGVNPGGGFLSPFQSMGFQAALMLKFFGGTGTEVFSYDAEAQAVFDAKGFEQCSADVSLETVIPVGDCLYFIARDRNFLHGNLEALSYCNEGLVQISSVHSCGAGYYEKGGLALQASFSFSAGEGSTSFYASPAVIVRIPRLIPLSCKEGFTYNLPLRVQLLFYPSEYIPFDIQLDGVIFSWDIQRGIPFLPVFFNRLTLAGGYEFMLVSGSRGQTSWDVLHADLVIQPSPNTGNAVHLSGFFTLGLSVKFYPHASEEKKWTFSLATSLAL